MFSKTLNLIKYKNTKETRRIFCSEQKIRIVMEALRERYLLQNYAENIQLMNSNFTNEQRFFQSR